MAEKLKLLYFLTRSPGIRSVWVSQFALEDLRSILGKDYAAGKIGALVLELETGDETKIINALDVWEIWYGQRDLIVR